ncbi:MULTISPECIES: hypothetical protein [Rhodomicrobium]|uniref:hypothetical protein n=1 Tax=Rhodomicrobium TaxID=1068 RepID=UPI000B4BE477|nr:MULTISPECIES: hypothetical protein [Rhodomicrobium]
MQRIVFLVLALVFCCVLAKAESRAEFCARWHKVCRTTCPTGVSKATCNDTCAGRIGLCQQSGCYNFRQMGPQCEGDPVPTCSERHQRCLSAGNGAKGCDARKAACLKTGRWTGRAGSDFGPTRKQ